MKRILALLLVVASVLLPTQYALAVQYDMIKNMTASTRTYNVSNPTATISIPGGQEAIIQDTQYQSSSAMQSDVSAGYLQEIVIGSPNATQTQYTQPVTITSTSSSAAGLLISESNGLQPGISVTQNNSGDIADFYQSATLEYGLSNTLFHVAPLAQFDQNLVLDHSVAAGGLLQFGSGTTAQVQYNISAPGAPSLTAPAQNTFAFSQPLTIENYNGVYLGTYQVLYSDNTATNLTLQAPGSSGSVVWKNGSGTLGSITSSGLTLGSSTYGTNVSIGGTLTVAGLTNLGALVDSTTTTTNVIGNNGTNKDLQLNAGASAGHIALTNSTGATINSQFNDDGSGDIAKNNITWDGSGNLVSTSLKTYNQLFMGNAGYFNVSSGFLQYVDGASGGFKVLNNATTASNIVLNDNGSGNIAQGNISWTQAGVLTVAGLTSSNGLTITGNTSINGTLTAGDITTSRSATTGYLFLGSNGSHSIGFDGTNYQLSSAGLVLNGTLSAQAIIENATLTLVPLGTATSVNTYASNIIALQNSTWNGTSAVTNSASIQLASNGALTFSTPSIFQFNGNTSFNSNVTIPGTLTTGAISNSGVIALNSGSNPLNITSSVVNFSSSQSLSIGSTTLSATGLSLNGGLTATTGSFSGNISGTTENLSGALTISSLTTNGNALVTGLIHAGGSSIAFGSNGDVVAERGTTTGYLYLGNTGTHFLNFDGTQYNFGSTANISAGGQITAAQFNGSGAGLTNIPNGALTALPVDTISVTSPITIAGTNPSLTISCATCMTGLVAGSGITTTGGTDPTVSIDQTYYNIGATKVVHGSSTADTFSIALPSYGTWHLKFLLGAQSTSAGNSQISINIRTGTCSNFGTNAAGNPVGPGPYITLYSECDANGNQTVQFGLSISQGALANTPYQPWEIDATRTS